FDFGHRERATMIDPLNERELRHVGLACCLLAAVATAWLAALSWVLLGDAPRLARGTFAAGAALAIMLRWFTGTVSWLRLSAVCQGCGHPVSKLNVFCSRCGARLDDDEPRKET